MKKKFNGHHIFDGRFSLIDTINEKKNRLILKPNLISI